MAHRFTPAACPRLIVKVGSALLVDGDGHVRHDWLASLVADLAACIAAGQQVAVVSSGAIALGARRLGLAKGGRASLEDAQAAAATGQIALAGAWAALIGEHGLTAAQMLVTLDDLEDRRRYLNAAATLDRLLGLRVVPVINENDSVATAEIRFGDNDRLAARVAVAARASGVILLSDVDGLHTADPARDALATRIAEVATIDARIEAMASDGSGSGLGSGGMASKIAAARIATQGGAALMIASGLTDHPLARALAGGVGTVFAAVTRPRPRLAWLAGRARVRGTIHVDAGAAAAIARGASLLPAGIVRVDGGFVRGDLVAIAGPAGDVARGLSEYDAVEVARIAGAPRDAVAALLGHTPRSAVVHRDQMVRH